MEQKTEASQAVDERPLFEKTMNDMRFFPRELDFTMSKSPSGRDEYANAHLQSCWVGWSARAALKAQPAPTEAAQGEDSALLADGYKSSTMVSDFYGPKVTLHYETTAQADTAHDTLVSMIERASSEKGGVKRMGRAELAALMLKANPGDTA